MKTLLVPPLQLGQVAHEMAMNNVTKFTFEDDRSGTGYFRLTYEDLPDNNAIVRLVQGLFQLPQLEQYEYQGMKERDHIPPLPPKVEGGRVPARIKESE